MSSMDKENRPLTQAPSMRARSKKQMTPIKGNNNSTADESKVVVAMRCRPLFEKEKANRANNCLRFMPGGQQVVLGKDRAFTYDHAFDESTSQEQIYDSCIKNLMEGLFEGYNATVFAYGQTGTGKTYTMGSGMSTSKTGGIIPSVIESLFHMAKEHSDAKINVRVSYLEIYNEEIRDLLHPDTPSKSIAIREATEGSVYVVGVQEEEVSSSEDMYRYLDEGTANRTTAGTLMNSHSSRSHSIFSIIVEQETGDGNEYISAKFHLVDLAGSERNKRTGTAGKRFQESVSINQGLLALGNVISALSSGKKRGGHIPYRESKLTRVLQDALGGNSRTLMLACVSPADNSFDETLNTLKYASRARFIKNKPTVNLQALPQSDAEELQNEIEELKRQLVTQGEAIQGGNANLKGLTERMGVKDQMRKVASLQQELDIVSHELVESEKALEEEGKKTATAEAERDSAAQVVVMFAKRLDSLLGDLDQLGYDDIRVRLKALAPRASSVRESGKWLSRPNTAHTDTLSGSRATLPTVNESCAASVSPVAETRIKELEMMLVRQEQETQQLKEAYADCKEDLMRDEEIFNEKMKQIKALQSSNMEQEATVQSLRRQCQQSADLVEMLRSQQQHGERATSAPSPVLSVNQDFAVQLEEDDEVMYTSDASFMDAIKDGMAQRVEGLEDAENASRPLEEAKSDLLAMAHGQATEFRAQQTRMERQLKDLTINIQQKQELIRMLVKNEQQAVLARNDYEKRVHEMEHEVSSARQGLDQMHGTDEGHRHREETRALQEEYEARIQEKEGQLADAKRALHNQEMIAKVKAQSEQKICKYEAQITQMKEQQKELAISLKEEQAKEEERKQETQRKLVQLQNELTMNRQRVRDVESENARQKNLLQRKTEEVEHARKQMQAYRDKEKQPNMEHDDSPSTSSTNSKKAWLDSEIEQYLQKKQAMEALEKQLEEREAIIQEREAVLSAKHKLELKRMRESHSIQEGLHSLGEDIGAMDMELTSKAALMKTVDAKALRQMQEDVQALQHRREDALAQMEELEQRKSDGQFLNGEDEMMWQEVDDRMDELDAEVEYKTSLIKEVEQTTGKGDVSTEHIISRLECMSDKEAKELLKKNVKILIAMTEKEQKHNQMKKMYALDIAERDELIKDLQEGSRRTKMAQDRIVTRMETEHAEEIQRLVAERAEVCDGVSLGNALSQKEEELEAANKDLYYYKQSYRELKRKLKQIQGAVKEDVNQKQQECDKVHNENAMLHEELKNMKAFMTRHSQNGGGGPVAPVRVSRSSLRSRGKVLDAEQVQIRASQATESDNMHLSSNSLASLATP